MTRQHRFYLVQRLVDHGADRPGADRPERGFDGFFGCDYMGAAEFEFGAVGDSLKRIRSADVVLAVHKVGDTPVYFVGPEKGMHDKLDDFDAWLAGEGHSDRYDIPWSKERTYFPEHLAGTASEYMGNVSAWWSLDDDVLWTLTASRAQRLVTAVNTKAKARA